MELGIRLLGGTPDRGVRLRLSDAGRPRAVLATALAGVLLGCSTPPDPPAAEPADAPPAAQPAGRVVDIGARPEGVVADPETGLVSVGVREPNALTILDGRNGQVADRIRLPGNVRHLQLAAPGGPVLLPSESANSLLTVELPSGEIADRVPTGKFPHDATAAANGTIFVSSEFGGSIAVVRDGAVVRTLTGLTQPGGIAADGNVVGVIDVRRNDLSVYHADTLRRLGRIPAGDGPTHVVAARGGRLLVADTRGDALLVFVHRPQLRQVARLQLPGAPYGIAYDHQRRRLWVTLTGRNEVVGIDPAVTPPTVLDRLPTVRQPNTVAVDAKTGRLFITGTKDGVLQLIDP